MSLSAPRFSFAAGSTSLDPFGYRDIGQSKSSRFKQLVDRLPRLARFLNSSSLIVNAYPATLALEGLAPIVDTYLHAPTFIRAMRLAEVELRPVVLAAQPLAGADLIVKLLNTDFDFPREVFWAVGGYVLPRTLEEFISSALRARGCSVSFLHCYGVAEVGHTVFAATERSCCGLPRYLHIADEIEATTDSDSILQLFANGKLVSTGDYGSTDGQYWKIKSNHDRVHPYVLGALEKWTGGDWSRRTGYLFCNDRDGFKLQLREGVTARASNEIEHFEFWSKIGGSFQTKPKWKLS